MCELWNAQNVFIVERPAYLFFMIKSFSVKMVKSLQMKKVYYMMMMTNY